MQFLNTCKMYLSDVPSQEFLVKERGRIIKRMELVSKDYDYWRTTQVKKNSIEDYNKGMGVDDLKAQLKTINFLLNE